MARARLLHPEFARHEGLAELGHTHRLLFALLPTIADREGLLEDRPRRIKADLFPYDTDQGADVDNGLAELARIGCIQRVEMYGRKVITIPGFLRWNKPHPREKQSELSRQPVITKKEGEPRVSPRPTKGRKSPPVSISISDPVPVSEKLTAAIAPAEIPLPEKPEKKKPEPTPEQEACRRAIRARFESEFLERSKGEEFRWLAAEHVGIERLAALDTEGKGTDPAKGLRALEEFIRRMAVKRYYAENFAPRIVAQEINNLRLPVKADLPKARAGPGAASGAVPVATAEDFDRDEQEFQRRRTGQ